MDTTAPEGSHEERAENASELAMLRACDELARAADAALEQAMRERLPLAHTLQRLQPLLARHAGALSVRVRTLDEELAWRNFDHPADREAPSDARAEALLEAAVGGRRGELELAGCVLLAEPLEVAGEGFGATLVELAQPAPRARVRRLLEVWCEELDGFLAAIARSRIKYQATRELSEALKHPLLEAGIDQAIEVLRRNVAFDDLVLAYRHEDDLLGASVGCKVIARGRELYGTQGAQDDEIATVVRERGSKLITDGVAELAERLGIERGCEEVLISGLKSARLVGRLIVNSRTRELNTFDRDLLERFADYLRQRIVDFNREWKQLAASFAPAAIVRLLEHEDYVERFLQPREREVAVMFCDISGFTRVSEQLLRSPAAIGELIDRWGAGVVRVIWEEQGVFDKMVGDCAIALWGPPFFELDPSEACRRALAAAERVVAFTAQLGGEIAPLREMDPPLTVSTGLNFCPLFVGLFGPNVDYTGFSSGMNNAARLQGLAASGETLCMERFVDLVGQPDRFGPPQQARVKNVARPLRYRALL